MTGPRDKRECAAYCGFTLLETLIAVSILALATAAPLYSANRAYVAATGARDQLVASYLAQEGIEYARALRDNAYLDAYTHNTPNTSIAAWNTFLYSGVDNMSIEVCRDGAVCTLDLTTPTVLKSCSGACTPLYRMNTKYTQRSDTGGTITNFTRTLQAVDIKDGTGAVIEERIDSTVRWQSRGAAYAVTSSLHLTPWQ